MVGVYCVIFSMKRRDFFKIAAGTVAAMASKNVWGQVPTRPNIVVIVVDDMRFDEYGSGGHPYLKTPHIDALGASGATFTNAYHTTPLCSPNRASILTGQYTSKHGVLDNSSRSLASHKLHTFAQELQKSGYETAHVGKWHMGNDASPRPGYDYWVSFQGQGKSYDPDLYEDGRIHNVKGYVTDIFTDRAIDFISRERDKPFMVYVGHKAIHPEIQQKDDGGVNLKGGKNFIPASRHKGHYKDKVFPRRPNFGMSDSVRKNKPVLAKAVDFKNSDEIQNSFGKEILDGLISEETIQRRAEMMLAVDEGVGRMIATLEKKGLKENTVFVLMSDNGYFFGEHGLSIERRLPYEEAIKCPLIISHPVSIEKDTRIDDFALSIDIAPTILNATKTSIPKRVQGRSLLPLLQGNKSDWRKSFLVEYFATEKPFPWTHNLDYRVVRLGQYKYIRWNKEDDGHELYDLKNDPFEQINLALNPAFKGIKEQALNEMESLVVESLGF